METVMTRKEATDHLMSFLASKGPGWQFHPHEVTKVCSKETGKSATWYRMIVSTDLTAMGIVKFDSATLRYEVA